MAWSNTERSMPSMAGRSLMMSLTGGKSGLLSSTSSGTSVLMETILWTYPSLRKVRR